LAVATFIEKYYGTDMARRLVYFSPVFFLLQLLLILNFIFIVLKNKYLKQGKWGMLLLHGALTIILAGALITHLFSEEGYIHIREGEKSDRFHVQSFGTTIVKTLPFSLELLDFTLHRYPGSGSPSSYESELRVYTREKVFDALVYMNHTLDVDGYRFFQASFDKDEKGTVLSVNKDVCGRSVTYAGYLLLFAGFILCFTGKNSRLRVLFRMLKKTTVTIIFVLCIFRMHVYASGQPGLIPGIENFPVDREHAKAFGTLALQSSYGRIVPVNTFSSEILRKLYHSDRIGAMDADQFLLSLLIVPELWSEQPLIHVTNKELIHSLNLSGKKCAYADLFDANGNYKLEGSVNQVYGKTPTERSKLDKDLLKLDEKANILLQLFDLQLLHLFPDAGHPDHPWYSPGDDLSVFSGMDSVFVSRIMGWYLMEVRKATQTGEWQRADEVLEMISTYQSAKCRPGDIDNKKIQAELKYNRMNIFSLSKRFYLMSGVFLLVLGCLSWNRKSRYLLVGKWLLSAIIIACFLFHTYGICLRWYIGEHAPFSNSYETMVYVGWATVLAGLLFISRSTVTLALATLFGGVILFVSGLNWMDPQITPLVPVLKSPWLMFHVAVIVAAYGFMGISFLIGATNLGIMTFGNKKNITVLQRIGELSIINEISLLTGLILMTTGTFLGAIWANESWGRYWGWDPKETWALVTIVVYAVATHLRMAKRYYNLWIFNVLSVFAFASVLMTFFGVNYFLSGMHSYGSNSNVNAIFVYLYVAGGLLLLLSVVSYRSYKTLHPASGKSVDPVVSPDSSTINHNHI
jgi:cytochrome c-type biogenesis protein CcsB